ncbi:hypothetical protein [Loktanella sp. Alg231-35]|uniref:hypothetical protein n=1 Tax=Loktanella sp. Alg231-35 TaxID=1922220 RepID=UPI000D54F0A2|nr:hypothetical protein [Loktanella sp. Alg231-35]
MNRLAVLIAWEGGAPWPLRRARPHLRKRELIASDCVSTARVITHPLAALLGGFARAGHCVL